MTDTSEILENQEAEVTQTALVVDPNALTLEQLKMAMPDQLRRGISQTTVDRIHTLINNPDMYEEYRDNLLSYASVMKDGRFKMEDYVNAVKYVSHKLRGDSNIDAYVKTFPAKYQSYMVRGMSSKDISAYVAAYNKNKLVNLIYEQTAIPVWVLNQDLKQKAINQLATLMMTAKSEKVQADSANALLTHLKTPETTKVQLDIGVQQDDSINSLRTAVQELAAHQRDAIRAGAITAQDAAHSKLIVDVAAKEI